MPAVVPETPVTPATPAKSSGERNFIVESQSLKLDFDFATQTVLGSTLIRIQPLSKEIRSVSFNCRECSPTKVTVEGKDVTTWKFDDSYRYLKPPETSTVNQHHQLQARLDALQTRTDGELTITLPRTVKIRELDQFSGSALPNGTANTAELGDSSAAAAGRYSSIAIHIFFETRNARDGFHWVGCDGTTTQWPHVYTRTSPFSKSACCMFPCVDDPGSRHPWKILIGCPRTLGDAFGASHPSGPSAGNEGMPANGISARSHSVVNGSGSALSHPPNKLVLSTQEMELNMTVTCSGDLTDVTVDSPSRKTVSFLASSPISADQIGLAIGPFEDVDLSDLREVDEDERLGEQAVRVRAYCLPGRSAEVRNTCMPLAKAVDFFTTTFTTFTGESWKLCFVDDLVTDTIDTAGFSICSTRLLFPEDIIDPLYPVTRKLVLALATQYAGVNIVPREPTDAWVIAGISSFMTDTFMRSLCGSNEYRFRQKRAADRVAELDVNRPSIHDLGGILHIDPLESEFMNLKAGVVLFLLDRRLTKSSGSAGMTRIIGRILNNAKAEELESSLLSTAQFTRLCVKMGHVDLDIFFNQWVFGAGCPSFEVRQTFNKKRLSVTMTVSQVQADAADAQSDLDPKTFLRDIKEDSREIDARPLQPVFTGPMTVRIHEADGTPTEHIIEISRAHQTFEIPYNNKYKRKKSKRQRARLAAAAGANAEGADGQDDVLLYCLGDVLQSEEEVANWRLTDWTKDMEEKMSEESYEWIRMDADFEWICKLYVHMPAYMWVSQLQQDRDVVAQMESLKWINLEIQKKAHPLTSTFLIRTLMDKRYFYGIRTLAASMLSGCAKAEVEWVGLYQLQKAFQELCCVEDSEVTKPNDFSDRTSYIVQCAILQAISDVKDNAGRAPPSVKRYFLDRLRYNDNSNNEFSDVFYVALLLQCITKSLLGPPVEGDDDAEIEAHTIHKEAIAQIDRYRRMDEWTSSFQNVFTTTTLNCLLELAKGKVVKPKFTEFLHYTRPENSVQVRVQAFDGLVELGMLKNKAVMKYMLHEMGYDPSPHVRANLHKIFGKGLGMIAIGTTDGEGDLPVSSGLVIEQGGISATEAKQAEVSRRQTTGGALEALKTELANNESFKQALWHSVRSPRISAHELSNLVEICALLFDATSSLLIKFRLPRYWKAKHLGSAKLLFTQTSKVRWQPPPPPKPATPNPPAAPSILRRDSSPGIPLKLAFENSLKRKESSSHINGGGPAKKSKTDTQRSPSAAPGPSPSPSAEPKRSNIIKLKTGAKALQLKPQQKAPQPPSASSYDVSNSAAQNVPHLGFGPVNGASNPVAAPMGYGQINGPPAQTSGQPAQPAGVDSTSSQPPPQSPLEVKLQPQPVASTSAEGSADSAPHGDLADLQKSSADQSAGPGGSQPAPADHSPVAPQGEGVKKSIIEGSTNESSQTQTLASTQSTEPAKGTISPATEAHPAKDASQPGNLETSTPSTEVPNIKSELPLHPDTPKEASHSGSIMTVPNGDGTVTATSDNKPSADPQSTQTTSEAQGQATQQTDTPMSPPPPAPAPPKIKLRLSSFSAPKSGRP